MGILNWLGMGKDLAEPINAVGNLYTTDKARIEAETKLQEVVQKPILSQMANNAIMAASSNFFNSGWQAMMGWTAGFLILLYYAPQILITDYVWARSCIQTGAVMPFPMKPDDLLNLVGLMFGMGGLTILKKS